MKFKNYIYLSGILETAIHIPENFDWVKDFTLPSLDINLPHVEKQGKIQIIMDKINPIYIQISDGSKMFFTFDEFKRITGKPAVGKTIVWRTQRLPDDRTNYPSKITMCKII